MDTIGTPCIIALQHYLRLNRVKIMLLILTLSVMLCVAVELLSGVVQSASLSEADIEQQRGVVLKELEEVEASLQDVCLDLLHATAFQGTPLSQSIFGPSQNARYTHKKYLVYKVSWLVDQFTNTPVLPRYRMLTRQDLVEYINSHYKAPRMVLAAAGGNAQASAFTDKSSLIRAILLPKYFSLHIRINTGAS